MEQHPEQEQNITFTPESGLTEAEARERLNAGLGNTVPDDNSRSVGRILRINLLTFFNLINVLLGLSLVLVGSYRNMLFLGTVISNTCISIIQELRARSTLKKLCVMNESPITAVRDGKEVSISPRLLVAGDLVRLNAGTQVPADCVVREGTGSANEALITGESDNIPRHEGEMLLSGSYISSGSFTAQCVRVGAESYAARLTREARAFKSANSVLMSEMRKLIRLVSAVMVPLGAALFIRQHFISALPLKDSVVAAVGAMVGMIPNGLMLLVSMALTVGVIRLGKRGALVQELYGIEALARADVLCLDKTGTLTTGSMRVESFVPIETNDENELKALFSRFLGAQDAFNATAAAIAASVEVNPEKAAGVMPFTSERKYSAVSFTDNTVLIMGAADRIWKKPFPAEAAKIIETEAANGHRIIAMFTAKGSVDEDFCPEAEHFCGLAVLSDELRQGAAETLNIFRENGVDIRVISGDDPRTVSSIAAMLGIENAEHCVDVSTLDDPAKLREAVDRYRIFGRVTPDRKRALIHALKEAGHNVAMTGDGVNDIPAMKEADCSIAMASGSDATRHAAMVTLLNSDFTSMPAIVNEGRRSVNNVTRAASLFLVKTLYSLGLSLIILFLPLSYPFQPIQLTLISALTIGVPGVILALEPNSDPIRGRFLRTVLKRAIPGAAGVIIAAIGAMLLALPGYDTADCSCVAAVCAAAAGIAMLVSVCRPLNSQRGTLIAVMTFLLCGAILLKGDLFHIPVLTLPSALLAACGIGALICIAAFIILNVLLSKHELRFPEKLGL